MFRIREELRVMVILYIWVNYLQPNAFANQPRNRIQAKASTALNMVQVVFIEVNKFLHLFPPFKYKIICQYMMLIFFLNDFYLPMCFLVENTSQIFIFTSRATLKFASYFIMHPFTSICYDNINVY